MINVIGYIFLIFLYSYYHCFICSEAFQIIGGLDNEDAQRERINYRRRHSSEIQVLHRQYHGLNALPVTEWQVTIRGSFR